MLQSIAWFPKEDEALLEQFNRWVQALGYILKCHLRKGEGLTTDLQVHHRLDPLCMIWQSYAYLS